MTNSSVSLHELRRRIYVKAKAQTSWRFWGLYVHVCKTGTLREAYRLAQENNGAPGIDGVTFEAIEEQGVVSFVEHLRKELIDGTYRPLRARKVGIPKDGGKTRVLSIPAIRDRVVQGALKLILEPIFEADFQEGSFGYRPRRSPHGAIQRVSEAILEGKTHVIDLDLRAYFDTVRHHIVLEKVAKRVNDDDVMHLLKLILKASGKLGVPQGGVISPLLSNLYLTEVDRMLERAKEVTRNGRWTTRAWKVGIPKDGGKTRVLSIPAIRDRVVQGALKLILEPIFEADFQEGSFGYRPRRSPHGAIQRVSEAILEGKTHVIDLDLRAYFDTVRHHIVLEKVAKRVNDDDVMHLLKLILKASGKLGVPQGGVISPLLSNLYLTEVDRMLERAKEVTRKGRWTSVEYARFADDRVPRRHGKEVQLSKCHAA